jgi:hypothetical protein
MPTLCPRLYIMQCGRRVLSFQRKSPPHLQEWHLKLKTEKVCFSIKLHGTTQVFRAQQTRNLCRTHRVASLRSRWRDGLKSNTTMHKRLEISLAHTIGSNLQVHVQRHQPRVHALSLLDFLPFLSIQHSDFIYLDSFHFFSVSFTFIFSL